MQINEAVDIVYDKAYMEGVRAAFVALAPFMEGAPTVEQAFKGERATVGQFKQAKQVLAASEERERRLREALEQTDCFCHTEFTCGRCAALDAAKEAHE